MAASSLEDYEYTVIAKRIEVYLPLRTSCSMTFWAVNQVGLEEEKRKGTCSDLFLNVDVSVNFFTGGKALHPETLAGNGLCKDWTYDWLALA